MRTVFTFLIAIFFMGYSGINILGQTVTIGTDVTENNFNTWPTPYGNYEYGARYQIIIKGSELSAAGGIAGNITGLAFDVSNVNGCATLSNFTIEIGNSTKTNFNSDNSWMTGLTTVYTGSYQPVSGWHTHTFSTPFYWDGTSDIVIESCFYNGSYSENASTKYSTTGEYMVVGSEGSFDPCSNTTTAYTYYQRPNIKLTMQTSSGIAENYITNNNISVYPNPTKNHFIVKNSLNEILWLKIYDVNHKIIQIVKIDNKLMTVGCENISNGTYIYQIVNAKGTLISQEKFTIIK